MTGDNEHVFDAILAGQTPSVEDYEAWLADRDLEYQDNQSFLQQVQGASFPRLPFPKVGSDIPSLPSPSQIANSVHTTTASTDSPFPFESAVDWDSVIADADGEKASTQYLAIDEHDIRDESGRSADRTQYESGLQQNAPEAMLGPHDEDNLTPMNFGFQRSDFEPRQGMSIHRPLDEVSRLVDSNIFMTPPGQRDDGSSILDASLGFPLGSMTTDAIGGMKTSGGSKQRKTAAKRNKMSTTSGILEMRSPKTPRDAAKLSAAITDNNVVPKQKKRGGDWTADDDTMLAVALESWNPSDDELKTFGTKKDQYAAMWQQVALVFAGRTTGAWDARSCADRVEKLKFAYKVITFANANGRSSWSIAEDKLHRDLRVARYTDEAIAILLNFAGLGNSRQRNAMGVRGRWSKAIQARHLYPLEYKTFIDGAQPIDPQLQRFLRMDVVWEKTRNDGQ